MGERQALRLPLEVVRSQQFATFANDVGGFYSVIREVDLCFVKITEHLTNPKTFWERCCWCVRTRLIEQRVALQWEPSFRRRLYCLGLVSNMQVTACISMRTHRSAKPG